jgi:hypothetical protein
MHSTVRARTVHGRSEPGSGICFRAALLQDGKAMPVDIRVIDDVPFDRYLRPREAWRNGKIVKPMHWQSTGSIDS